MLIVTTSKKMAQKCMVKFTCLLSVHLLALLHLLSLQLQDRSFGLPCREILDFYAQHSRFIIEINSLINNPIVAICVTNITGNCILV